MKLELLIMRHGRAGHPLPENRGMGDFARELTTQGKRDAQRIGAWLAGRDLVPDVVLSSPAFRAVNTAEKACKAAGLPVSVVKTDEGLYLADPATLLKSIRVVSPSFRRVFVVGHNPGLETLVRRFDPGRAVGRGFAPGTLARVEVEVSEWSKLRKGSGTCIEVIAPDRLPRRFPFPDSDGQEKRSRPSYYYRQSGVIPFRITGDDLEVLIISTRKRKRWGVPKGIHDPGLTAQESAGKEAYEEGGVLGKVHDELIGEYTYRKWGARCHVKVYPMEVTRELGEDQWLESHRGRRWVPIEQAVEIVDNEDVGDLIRELPGFLETGPRGR